MTLTCINAQIWGLSKETSQEFSKIADENIGKMTLAPFRNMLLKGRFGADNLHNLPQDSTYVRLQFLGKIGKDREIDPNRTEKLIRNVFNKMNLDTPLNLFDYHRDYSSYYGPNIKHGANASLKFRVIK